MQPHELARFKRMAIKDTLSQLLHLLDNHDSEYVRGLMERRLEQLTTELDRGQSQ